MRVLLTGGFGYIGGRLARMLAAANGYELTLGTRRMAQSPSWAPEASVCRLDWASHSNLSRVCHGMDAVVHLAGMNAGECSRDPVAALEFNGVGTARLLRAAVEQQVSRFVYLSTAHVYGRALRGRVDEQTRPEPYHPYATSHRAGEDVVAVTHVSKAIVGIVIRLSNSYGPPADPKSDCWSLAINDFCRQVSHTRSVTLKTAGLQRRDFVPLAEACRAIEHLLHLPAPDLGDGIFNVGSGWAPTMLETAEAVAAQVESTLGFRPHVHRGTAIDSVAGDALEYSVQRLMATGFKPRPAAIIEELRQLILFCAQHDTAITA